MESETEQTSDHEFCMKTVTKRARSLIPLIFPICAAFVVGLFAHRKCISSCYHICQVYNNSLLHILNYSTQLSFLIFSLPLFSRQCKMQINLTFNEHDLNYALDYSHQTRSCHISYMQGMKFPIINFNHALPSCSEKHQWKLLHKKGWGNKERGINTKRGNF